MDKVIYHDFRHLNIIHPSFALKSQIMMLSQFVWKSDFLGHAHLHNFFFIMLKNLEENLKYLWRSYKDFGVNNM